MNGYIQVYTGNGKGKTTAALGLALRAAGAGLKIHIIQFLKQGDYNEIKALTHFADAITIEQYGTGCFVKGKPSKADIDLTAQGLATAEKSINSGAFDIVILEEISVAMSLGLVSEARVLAILKAKPDNVEVVLTGRNAPETIIEIADLVTEMKEIKHYYARGVHARQGIEK